MACYDIYIIWFPPDPTSLASGSNPYGKTVVMRTPPPPGYLPGGAQVHKTTIYTEIVDPPIYKPTGTYTPPGGSSGQIDFEEDDDGNFSASLPDTGGQEYEFDFDIPLEEGEAPETIPLNFSHAGFRASGVLGETYVYTTDSSGNLCRIDAETGTVLKTWEYDIRDIAVSSGGDVIFAAGDGIYLMAGDSISTIESISGFGYYTCGFGLNNEICVFIQQQEGGE